MPRFVILEHDFPFLHWDFMLEVGGSLKTWRLLQQPILGMSGSGKRIRSDAELLPDHRIEYLDYDGKVSRNRGTVSRWDAGMYLLLTRTENLWELRLEGQRLHGFVSLIPKGDNWEFLMLLDGSEET